jgi:single-strand selective monofunctional uracil DNA glycosylase
MDVLRMMLLAAEELRDRVERLAFSAPVTHVYNPLVYASEPHRKYLSRWGATHKKAVFLGMNPGPWGMADPRNLSRWPGSTRSRKPGTVARLRR